MNSHSSHRVLLSLALTFILTYALPQWVKAQTAAAPTVGVTQFIPSVNGGICGFRITFDPSGSTAAYAAITVGAVSGSPVTLSAPTLHVWTTDTTYSVPAPTSANVWNVYKGTPAGQPYSVVVQVVQAPTSPLPGSATYATGPITAPTPKLGPVVGTAIQLQTMSFESTVNSAIVRVDVTMNGGGGR